MDMGTPSEGDDAVVELELAAALARPVEPFHLDDAFGTEGLAGDLRDVRLGLLGVDGRPQDHACRPLEIADRGFGLLIHGHEVPVSLFSISCRHTPCVSLTGE